MSGADERTMSMIVVCLLCFFASVSAIALRPLSDGFILQDIDGERHLGYGVVPAFPGDKITLQFYDIELDSQSCDDVKVEVYSNGYITSARDLMTTVCDAEAKGKVMLESSKGFVITLTTSSHVHGGQIKARFSNNRGIKVTRQVFH